MQDEEEDLTGKMVAGGLTVAPANAGDREEAEARMKPYWNSWAKAHGPEAVAVLAEVRAVLGR